MEITCPACRKPNQTTLPEPVCSRCGCELTALLCIQAAAISRLVAARRALQQCQWHSALSHATQSWTLRHSREAASLAAIAAVGLGENDLLQQWQTLLSTAEPSSPESPSLP